MKTGRHATRSGRSRISIHAESSETSTCCIHIHVTAWRCTSRRINGPAILRWSLNRSKAPFGRRVEVRDDPRLIRNCAARRPPVDAH